jgi:hypothetical protein
VVSRRRRDAAAGRARMFLRAVHRRRADAVLLIDTTIYFALQHQVPGADRMALPRHRLSRPQHDGIDVQRRYVTAARGAARLSPVFVSRGNSSHAHPPTTLSTSTLQAHCRASRS